MSSVLKVDQIQSDTGTVNQTSNLSFTGTGRRITGDFSNATIANRVVFQNSTTNAGTIVSSIPNGTSSTAQFVAINNSTPTNAQFAMVLANAAEISIRSDAYGTGTGTYLPLTMYTGGSERMRITTAGVVELTSGQLKFPASQNASADPNTLDDYEEGEWTPSFQGESAITSLTYNTRIGRYVKIGRLVVATCRVAIDSRSGGANSLAVSGFPFTFNNAENFQAGAVEHYGFGSWPSNIFSIGALGIGGTDFMNLLWNGSGTRTNVQVSSLVDGAGLIITVAYQTN